VTRLSDATLADLPADIERPTYDRANARVGVVHFGPGAFHRAHQATYFERLLSAGQNDWAVCAVSLRTPDVAEALTPQDGLYTLVERGPTRRMQVIGAIKDVLVGPAQREAVFARMADPGVRLITTTVTEKGYCLTSDGALDLGDDEVRADLAQPRAPGTFIGWLVEGLRQRREQGVGGLAAISCDNLSGNGRKLQAATLAFARESGQADLASWIEAEVAFPCSMVDSITPATTDEMRTEVAQALGVDDAWPVQREPFLQWVIEPFGADADLLREAGVTISSDVAAWERAKLRLLNGAHSTLAYLGLLSGYETVSRAMAASSLAGLIEDMMLYEIAPTVRGGDIDLQAYVRDVLARFRNPGISHQLAQIAWDGSKKVPFRLLETIADRLAANGSIDMLALAVASWIRFVEIRTAADIAVIDPLAGRFATLDGLDAFLAMDEVFPQALASNPRFREPVALAHGRLIESFATRVL
jgi:fructuronate reductase